jgi:GNAT superfamily N-acetyltransferase
VSAAGPGALTAPRRPAIRPARRDELARLGGLYARAGFSARLAGVVGFARARLGGEVFVADLDGELVGVAAAAQFGASGWVGGVAVTPERRRAGLGGALTEAVVAHLRDRQAATVQLLATELGRPVYERIGFAAEAEYVTLTGPPGPGVGGGVRWAPGAGGVVPVPGRAGEVREPVGAGGMPAAGVRAGRPGDRAAVLALDRLATGEDRRRLLSTLWPAGGLVAEEGALRGYHLASPWRSGGATVAADAEAGLALLEAVRRSGAEELSVSLPAGNRAGRLALEASGFQARSATTRMRLGPPLPWSPEAVFGAHNLFWG